VPAILDDQTRLLNVECPASDMSLALGGRGIGELLVVRSQQLLHVRNKLSVPGDRKNLARWGNIFLHDSAG